MRQSFIRKGNLGKNIYLSFTDYVFFSHSYIVRLILESVTSMTSVLCLMLKKVELCNSVWVGGGQSILCYCGMDNMNKGG